MLKTMYALLVISLSICGSLLAHVADAPAQRPTKPVTVADTIEMTMTGAGSFLDAGQFASIVEFSPDGRKFAFTSQKGDLQKDVIAYSVWVYDTATALTSHKPRLVARLESSSNRPAISQLKWLPDNKTLVFLGEEPGETQQIYKVEVDSGKLEKLTNEKIPIVSFSMSNSGDSFVYLAKTEAPPLFAAEEFRHGFYVTPGHQWDDLYLNKRKFDDKYQIYVATAGGRTPKPLGEPLSVSDPNSLSISPNGKYALISAYSLLPPTSWEQYQGMFEGDVPPKMGACLAGDLARCPRTYWLIDLRKQSLRQLINAPTPDKLLGTELAAWTKDNTVLLVNALLPLDGVSGEQRSHRERKLYSAEVTVPDGEIHPIKEHDTPLEVYSIAAESGRVVAKPGLPFDVPYEFRKRAAKWQMRQISREQAAPRLPLAVRLEQGLNEPPKLVADDPNTKQTIVLMDLNPQFREMSFGRVEAFKWKSRDGAPWAAELYYPVGYVAGQKYPLVIQTHGERRDLFWIQGPFSTTNAAQPLANKGFFVLQMGWGDLYDKNSLNTVNKAFSGPGESPYFTTAAESAIEELARPGLIDRNRVGLSGFSRTVYEAEYMMTHSNYSIGAAVLADGIDFGYVGCVYYPVTESLCELMNGGVPWGESLANWQKASPPMLLDRVHTPLLMQSISGPLGEWEIYAGLQWLKKPVELINFYPEGEHELVRPRQKLLSEQSAVDWYCFWLKGEEDPDPAKAEQYKRWRELRKLEEENAVKPVAQSSN